MTAGLELQAKRVVLVPVTAEHVTRVPDWTTAAQSGGQDIRLAHCR